MTESGDDDGAGVGAGPTGSVVGDGVGIGAGLTDSAVGDGVGVGAGLTDSAVGNGVGVGAGPTGSVVGDGVGLTEPRVGEGVNGVESGVGGLSTVGVLALFLEMGVGTLDSPSRVEVTARVTPGSLSDVCRQLDVPRANISNSNTRSHTSINWTTLHFLITPPPDRSDTRRRLPSHRRDVVR